MAKETGEAAEQFNMIESERAFIYSCRCVYVCINYTLLLATYHTPLFVVTTEMINHARYVIAGNCVCTLIICVVFGKSGVHIYRVYETHFHLFVYISPFLFPH